jgi:hypothetical protein
MVLDLHKLNWSFLGDLNEDLKLLARTTYNIGMLPWGLFTSLDNKLYLWNFKENIVFELNTNRIDLNYILKNISTSCITSKESVLIVS